MPGILSKLNIQLNYKIEELEIVRKNVLNFLIKNQINLDIISQVELSVYEVLINILKYSSVDYNDNLIDIEINIFKELIRVTICNYGDKFDLTKVELPEITSHFKSGMNHGLGIYMIRTLMDKIEYAYEDNLNRLTIIKNT